VRVLVTASTFPLRPDDGIPRFVADLCQALASRCEVTALVPDAPGAARRERVGDVDVHRFTYLLPRRWQALAYGDGIAANLASPRAWLQPLPFLAAQVAAVRTLAERLAIDVVSSHWILPQGLAAALARGARPRFAHVATLHGGDAFLLGRLPFARRLAGFLWRRSDALLPVSTGLRDAFDATLGRASGALVQPMGVSLARFAAPEAAAPPAPFAGGFLVCAARLVALKGVDVLLRALPRVLAVHPDLGLCVLGAGPREAALRAEAARLGIAGRVRFEGRVSQAEVARHLRACRAAVVPSVTGRGGRAEGMPTVVAEALAAEARLVATATGGIPDVVRHGENGWLCRASDPGYLAETILLALADRSPERARRARESAAALDWERVAARYFEVMQEACARRPRGAVPRARG